VSKTSVFRAFPQLINAINANVLEIGHPKNGRQNVDESAMKLGRVAGWAK
jgi:hypothetical protein